MYDFVNLFLDFMTHHDIRYGRVVILHGVRH